MQAFLLLVVQGAFWRDAPQAKGGFLSQRSTRAGVLKPSQDPRTYAYETLPNGMRVLVVQDPTAAKAGFAVGVDAGSFSDGLDFPGVAHFCEHMLFLGNEKYPDQGDFDNYLSQHDGGSNAYTDQEMTIYFNEVGMSGLEGGLERFSQFFIAPLFNVSMATKEVNAVNQEHDKNKPSAFRRTWEVMRSLANPESVVPRFYTGDKETLLRGDPSGKKVVAALQNYHSKNYCPERETGVIVANMTTDELMDLARKYYGQVPAKLNEDCIQRREFNDQEPWDGHLGKMIQMGTSSSQAQLWLMFSMPRTWDKYASQPGSYLSFLFSDASQNSLQSALKSQNLATGVSNWLSDTSAGGMFWVTIDLTDEGEKDYAKVLELVYSYCEKVRAASVDGKTYKSLENLAQVHFDYQDPPSSSMDQVSTLASGMIQYEIQDVLAGNYLMTKPDEAQIKTFLERLQPQFSNVGLVSPAFTDKEQRKQELLKSVPEECKASVQAHYEENYEVEYVQLDVCGDLKKRIEEPKVEVELKTPAALEHVPAHFAVTEESSGVVPVRLHSERAEAWWTGIGSQKLPKAEVNIKLAFPTTSASAELAAAGLLHAELVRLALEEEVDELLSCGLSYGIAKEGDAFTLSFSGFDDHMEVLMEKVLKKVRKPAASSFVFERSRLAKMRSFQDVTSAQAYQHGLAFYSVAMDNDAYSREEYLHYLNANTTTLERVQEVVQHAMERSRLTMLLVGNLPQARAEKMVALVEAALLQDDLPESLAFRAKVVKPQSGGTELRVPNPIPGDTNHATINVYQWPKPPTIEERVKLLLLGNMLYRAAFDDLRTTRQLGYVVSAGVSPHGPVGELKVLVQGTKATPDQVDKYIEEMLSNFGSSLYKMEAEEFENWRHGLHTQLAKEDQTMHAEAARFWHAIRDESYCFDKKHLSVAALDKLTDVKELAGFFEDLLDSQRTKVAVKVWAEEAAGNITASPTGDEAVTFVTTAAADKLRPENPKYYPNDHLCPDKVSLLANHPVRSPAFSLVRAKASKAEAVRASAAQMVRHEQAHRVTATAKSVVRSEAQTTHSPRLVRHA